MRNEISKKDIYLNNLFSFEDDTLKSIQKKLEEDDKWGINIGFHEISVLNFLIKSLNIKTALEIGTLYGFSTYAMASSLPIDGQIISIEKNKKNYLVAQNLLNSSLESSKISLVHQDALNYLKNCNKKFDLIFIDANKSGYEEYLSLSLKLLSKEGIIIGDNTFLFGHVYEEGLSQVSKKAKEAVVSFNSQLIGNDDFLVTIIPTTEGMTLIKKIN